MSALETFAEFDVLADHLRNSGVSLEQKVDALLGLEAALQSLPIMGDLNEERSSDDRNLDRAIQISEMTQLGELAGLSILENLVDADVRQRLLGLCRQPMSHDAETEFRKTLDQVTRAAQADAARLQELVVQNERDRLYRDLLGDMQNLLDLLSGGGTTGSGDE